MFNLVVLHYTKKSLRSRHYNGLWHKSEHDPGLIKTDVSFGAYFGQFSESVKIIEPAVTLNVNRYSDTKFTGGHVCDWDLAVLNILAFVNLLLVCTIKIAQVDSTIDRSRDKNFVIEKSNTSDGSGMLLYKILFKTKC